MKKYLLTFIAVLAFFTLFSTKVDAAVIEKEYNRVYEAEDSSVKVSESKKITITQPALYIPAGSEESFIIFNPIEGDPNASEKVQKTLNSITVTDNLGRSLNYSSETTSGQNLLIKVRFPANVVFGSPYTLNLSYISYGLLIKSGAIRDMYIPAFSKDYIFENSNSKETVTTKAKIPQNFGEINFTAPEVGIAVDGSFWVAEFSQDKLIGETGWIQIGKTQYYSFNLKQSYQASTSIPLPFNTYRIVIPRNIKSGSIDQKVFFTNISPEPSAVYKDLDGNLIAEFRVPANKSGDIIVEGYSTLDHLDDLDSSLSGNIADINTKDFQTDLASAKYWESSTIEIAQAAREIKGTETNVYKLVQKTYQYVVDKIDYSDVKKFGINERQGALKTLRGGAAVCMEYSDLFIALMRAMGIPARGAFGHGYSATDYTSTIDNTINHQWAEVYVPGMNSWIPVDTTWGENGPELIGGDLNHFYSHVASIDPDTPSTTEVSFYGFMNVSARADIIEPVEKSYLDTFTSSQTEEDLLNKYPKKSSPFDFVTNITDSIGLLTSTIDTKIDNTLTNYIDNAGLKSIVKLLIELSPVILLFVIFLVLIKKRRSKNTLKKPLFQT